MGAILALAAAPLLLAGCFDLGHLLDFPVELQNDTANPVVVRDCPDYCSSSALVFDLAPGQSTQINRPANQHSYFSVTSPGGAHLGCVDLYFSAYSPGAETLVSQASRCPGGSGIPWLPIVLILAGVGLPLAYVFARRPQWE